MSIKGYVSEIKTNSFIVINQKTGSVVEVSYLQVKNANTENPTKRLAIIGIAVGIASVVLLIIAGRSD
jgi:hypothetical protein